jgi:hypothetical protein
MVHTATGPLFARPSTQAARARVGTGTPTASQYPQTIANSTQYIGMGILPAAQHSQTDGNQASCVRTGTTGRRHYPQTNGDRTQRVGMGILDGPHHPHTDGNQHESVRMGIPPTMTIPEPTQTTPIASVWEYRTDHTIPVPTETEPNTSVREYRTGRTIPIPTETNTNRIGGNTKRAAVFPKRRYRNTGQTAISPNHHKSQQETTQQQTYGIKEGPRIYAEPLQRDNKRGRECLV